MTVRTRCDFVFLLLFSNLFFCFLPRCSEPSNNHRNNRQRTSMCVRVPLKGVPTPIRKLAPLPTYKNRRRRKSDSAYFQRGNAVSKLWSIHSFKMHSTRREEEENTYKRNVFNESAIINQEANKLLFNCLQERARSPPLLTVFSRKQRNK